MYVTPAPPRHPVLGTLVLACLLSLPAAAQENELWRSWNQPVEPFRIVGNLYYVGATDITSYLIATPEGHVVIDGGFPETAPLIRDSIAELGFEIGDVKILLNSHAHFDHAGGLAALKEWTGAELWISRDDAPVIASGGAGDYLLSAEDNAMAPVEVDRRLEDGEKVTLGGTTLVAHRTAGHTRGCTTWAMQIEDAGQTFDVVSVCSVTVLPGARLVDNPVYPEIAADYERSFETLEALPCDVFLAAHASFFRMSEKREKMVEGASNPFVDPEGYRRYVERGRERYLERLAEQRGEAPSETEGSEDGS